jgi:hypothetical protein
MNPFDLQRDAFGCWVLVLADGTLHSPVTAVRAYPVSAPDQSVALMDADGHEMHWVPDLSALTPALQATLREALDEREFLPPGHREQLGHAQHLVGSDQPRCHAIHAQRRRRHPPTDRHRAAHQ